MVLWPQDGEASLTESWDAGDLTTEQLELQEGNYQYSYKCDALGLFLSFHQTNTMSFKSLFFPCYVSLQVKIVLLGSAASPICATVALSVSLTIASLFALQLCWPRVVHDMGIQEPLRGDRCIGRPLRLRAARSRCQRHCNTSLCSTAAGQGLHIAFARPLLAMTCNIALTRAFIAILLSNIAC